MKTGYAARKQKAKAKKAARQKRKALKGKDAEMQDAHSSDQELEMQPTQAQPTHKEKVQLKRALKVRVASLKQHRSKLTKLPANKAARRELSTTLKSAIQEQRALNSKPKNKKADGSQLGKGSTAAAPPAAQTDGPVAMDE